MRNIIIIIIIIIKNQHRSLCSVKPSAMTLCLAQAVILRKPMVSGFNPTHELGAAGYEVVTLLLCLLLLLLCG